MTNTIDSDALPEDDDQTEESMLALELFEMNAVPLMLFQNEEGEEGQNELIRSMGNWAYTTVTYMREFPRYFQIMIESKSELFAMESDNEPTFSLHKEFPTNISQEEHENGFNVDLFIVVLDEPILTGDIDWGNVIVSGATINAPNGTAFTFSLRHLKALSEMLSSFVESLESFVADAQHTK